MRNVGNKIRMQHLGFRKLRRHLIQIFHYIIVFVIAFKGMFYIEPHGKIALCNLIGGVEYAVNGLLNHKLSVHPVCHGGYYRKQTNSTEHRPENHVPVLSVSILHRAVNHHRSHNRNRVNYKKQNYAYYRVFVKLFLFHFITALYPSPCTVTISKPSHAAVFSRSLTIYTSTVRLVAELS